MLPAHYNKKEVSYFCRFTFGQFFTILVLEIFTLFFIFYLGARYGREFLGIKEMPVPVAQKSDLPKVTTTDENVVSTTNDPEIKAMARNIAESAPTSDLKQRVEDMLKRSGEKRKEEKREPKFVAPKPVEETPAKPVAAQEPPPVIQTAPANARYSIQVGSYPNPDEAHEMVNGWKEKGYEAYLLSADIPDKGRWYRVRLGAFDTKEEAQKFLTQFKAKESANAFVTSNF